MNRLAQQAYSAGYYDALYCRVYRQSATTEMVNNWSFDYDLGWENGRRVRIGKLLFV